MKRFLVVPLFILLLSTLASAEKNPLVGMWLLQEFGGKASQTDPMLAAVTGFMGKTITFTEKSMEVNGQLQRVEYEISGHEVIVWVEKKGSRFMVAGHTMTMLLPNPLTGKTTEILYVRTTKEQAALAAKRSEAHTKAQTGENAKARQKEALAQLQGRWYARLVEEDGQKKYELFAISRSTLKEEVVFMIQGDQFLSFENGTPTPFFSFSVNPSPDPKTLEPMFFDAHHIDVTFTTPAMKGQSVVGLYRLGNLLGDETLGICLAKSGDRQRPRGLGTKQGDGRLCLTLVRSNLDEHVPVASATASPKAPDVRYLTELPDPQKVLTEVAGKDGVDTVARQVGAFEILAQVIKLRSDGRVYRNELTPEELAKFGGYQGTRSRLITEQNAKFDPNCKGPQCDHPTFFRLYNHYGLSKEFRQHVFDRFLSKPWQDEHRRFDVR